ncbi:MAG: TVP38/TMEM64 family protein [Spirochaetales bacterium]|nr:TVP38/TMEM64 family protein [Spirochaetales bacterium]
MMNIKKYRYLLFPALLAIALVLLVYLLVTGYFFSFFKNSKKIADWINSQGIRAWLVFVFVQIFQVIIFVIPGEFTQIAGGYLFGVFAGGLLSLAGITIGSVANFYIARLSGADFVRKIIGEERYERFRKVLSSERQVMTFFILFLIPGIPKDIVCYFTGLSTLSLARFLVFSTIGRIPGIVISVIFGAALVENRIVLMIILAGLSLLFFLLGLFIRKKFIKVKL